MCLTLITDCVIVWRRMPITMQGISYSVINRGRRGAISTLRGNIFTSSVIGSGLLVVIANYIISSSALDKLVATAEAVLMFYVAGPTATALGKLILQTTPKPLRNGIEGKLREVGAIFELELKKYNVHALHITDQRIHPATTNQRCIVNRQDPLLAKYLWTVYRVFRASCSCRCGRARSVAGRISYTKRFDQSRRND